MNFSNNNIIVTGGAQGIGESIALEFAKLKAEVFILDIDHQLGESISKKHENIHFYKIDLSSTEEIKNFIEKFNTKTIDVFIGNAGILTYKNINNFDFDDAHKIFDTNLFGHLKLIQGLKEKISSSTLKKIILMSSINGQFGAKESLLYNMTKASIENAVKSLCVDLAEIGINVNGIAPGFIKTRMSVLADGSDEFENENFKSIYLKYNKLPIGRYGNPIDIANVALLLASPLANYINGQIINVDGGVTSTF